MTAPNVFAGFAGNTAPMSSRPPMYPTTARQTGDGAQPIREVQINQLPSANHIVGWVQRDQDDRGLWEEVRIGDTSPLFGTVPAALVCNEDGSWA